MASGGYHVPDKVLFKIWRLAFYKEVLGPSAARDFYYLGWTSGDMVNILFRFSIERKKK